ncbi:MAG: type II secretion system protein GspK [Vulcanimicrobiota bacterium]
MVIILVLGLLIVAVTLTTTFSIDSNSLDLLSRRARGKEANYQVARSALELGLVLLRVDDADVDGAEDIWAAGPQEMTWEGRLLRLEVEDEERRFPINALVPESLAPGEVFKPSEEQDALAKALTRLLDRQGLSGQSATAALIDFMDPDNVPTVGGGEISRDPEIPVKNARLDSLAELSYVRDWVRPQGPPPLPLLGGLASELDSGVQVEAAEAEAFSDQNQQETVNQSNWSDWLSVHSSGKININTAPQEILLALDEEMTDALVGEIIAKRQEGSFSGEEDLRQIATIDEDLLFRLGRLIRYNSEYFRVRIRVSSAPAPINVEAVVLRDKREPKIVRWEVH